MLSSLAALLKTEICFVDKTTSLTAKTKKINKDKTRREGKVKSYT